MSPAPGSSSVRPDGRFTGRAGGSHHSVWRERLIAGLGAGTVVLCWFVLFDALTMGGPWLTVQRIGGAIARLFSPESRSPTLPTSIAFFGVVHYGAWVANAAFVLGVVHRGKAHPTIVLPALLLSAIAYVPLIGIVTMLVQLGWESGAWLRFTLGTLMGGLAVAAQAWRTHPDLVRYELAHIGDDEG